MSSFFRPQQHQCATLLAATLLAACGGALDSASDISNPAATPGQRLSYAYFQRCVAPLLNAPLSASASGGIAVANTCASSGCHDNTQGTGGALRLFGSAPAQDLTLPAATLRGGEMYRNYLSALGETVPGSPEQSRLLNKPLVRGVLHGGGLIFASPEAPAAQRIRTWIQRPMPAGQDEFSSAANNLFTPPDAATGDCNNN